MPEEISKELIIFPSKDRKEFIMFKICFHRYKYVYEKITSTFLSGTCSYLRKRFRICQKCRKAQELKDGYICEPFTFWRNLSECERKILLENIEDVGSHYLLKDI